MEFDRSRVYTALNADELKVGSVVCVAKNMHSLKHLVHTDTFFKLVGISDEDFQDRFEAEWTDLTGHPHNGSFTLAYLVESPTELKWTDLKIGDVIRNGEFYEMITGIHKNEGTDKHVFVQGKWISDAQLKAWEKV